MLKRFSLSLTALLAAAGISYAVSTVYLNQATAPNAVGATDDGTAISLTAGNGGLVSGNGGDARLMAGTPSGIGIGGNAILRAGQGSGDGGVVEINAGDAGGAANGGSITIRPGNGGDISGNGGDLILGVGTPTSGTAGHITMPLEDFADDTAAATGGVPLNGIYRTGSTLKVCTTC